MSAPQTVQEPAAQTETKPAPSPLDQAIAATPEVNMRSIWAGEDQRYKTYDGRQCIYSMDMLDHVLGGQFANAPRGEKAAFIAVCINAGLDPLRRQVYFIKYQSDEPASFVTAWDVFLDRAGRHPMFDGFESGVVWKVEHAIERGQPCDYQQDKNHQLIGGWAIVYRKDQKHPRRVEVPLIEMQAMTRKGEPTKFWRKMPTTMCTKTPAARALRQSFPDVLGGLFIQEEIDTGHEFQSGDAVSDEQLDKAAADVAALVEAAKPEHRPPPDPDRDDRSDQPAEPPSGNEPSFQLSADSGGVQASENPFPDEEPLP